MTIGFWNINKKNLSDILVDFVKEQQLEILILAEADEQTIIDFLKKFNKFNSHRKFYQILNTNSKLIILSSYKNTCFSEKNKLFNSTRWSAHHIKIPSLIEFNLISVHFHSKVNWSESSLALECVNFSRDIDLVEKETKCYETVLIGDFNMNPFENGVIAANGLHAIQDLEYAHKKISRTIDNKKYNYFYNPMWNFFGDSKLPLGTHFYRNPDHISQEWNTFDQVIFRPSLKKYLNGNYVKIINRIITNDLTKSFNRPYKIKYSDHLPITFQLTI
jgi:hypothetical protein